MRHGETCCYGQHAILIGESNMTLTNEDLNNIAQTPPPPSLASDTPVVNVPDIKTFQGSSFYGTWSAAFQKLGMNTVVAIPSTTFDEWLWYFKQWADVFSTDYIDFKALVDKTLASMDKDFKDFVTQLPEYILSQIDQGGLLTKANFGFVEDIKQPIGVTAVDKLNNEFYQRAVNVEWFPRLAVETTDDGRIQRAIDSLNPYDTLLFSIGKTYTVAAGMQISNKSNVTINGNGARIDVITQLDTMFVFSYVGTVDKLDIFGFTIKNINPNPNYHLTAFGSNSGNILTNSEIHHLDIYSMNVGVSLNADLGGTVDNNRVYRNKLHDISGSDSGQGYGIHTAYGNNSKIYENFIDNAGRHAVYIAEGFNIHVSRNVIKNHRLNNSSNNYRPAINIAREAVNIKVDHNVFDTIRDSAIQIGNQNEKGDMRNVIVSNNVFINWVNVPAVRVGSDATTIGPYNAYNIIVSDNSFVSDRTFSAIVVNMGLGVIVKDNYIKYLAPAMRVDGITVTQSVQNALNNVLVKGNTFQIEGGVALAEFRGITFSGLASTGTANITAENNNFIGLFSDTGKNYFDYFSGVAITNPNLNYNSSRTLIKKNVAPTTGYHEVGEIAYNSNPNNPKNVGWVCTVAGNPGTWVAFGTFT